MRISFLAVSFLLLSLSSYAQDSLATVNIYRLGTSETNITLPIHLNGVFKQNLLARAVITLKCPAGVNKFTTSVENNASFTINAKPGGTYWVECEVLAQPIFRHVAKEEARHDLVKINKYVVEQVKDDATEPELTAVDTLSTCFVCGVSYKTYTYYNAEKYSKLSSEGITIIRKYLSYREEDKTSLGVTYINDEEFPYEVFQKNKIQQLIDRDENGHPLAMVCSTGPQAHDIQLPNGVVYTFAKIDATHWTYSLLGEVVIRGALKTGPRKSIQLEILKELQNPSVFMSSLRYGVYLILDRNSKGMSFVSSLFRL
jgi:hypothetical protein